MRKALDSLFQRGVRFKVPAPLGFTLHDLSGRPAVRLSGRAHSSGALALRRPSRSAPVRRLGSIG
jgi:hypothetical protein